MSDDVNKFYLVRSVGTPRYVEFTDGLRLYNDHKDYIEMPEWGRRVKKAPYDNHFIARVPKGRKGWFAYCSCGSPAVVVGYDAYRKDASPSSGKGYYPGELMVCHHHATFGKHQDSSG